MNQKTETTSKKMIVRKSDESIKFWMTDKEFTGIVVGKEATNSEYVITEGIIEPNGYIPNHYHKWEDQTFHVITGKLEVKIGNEVFEIEAGDSVHCPRGVSHFMKNIGNSRAKLISYIFPGDWAEEFMAETSKQVKSGEKDLKRIEELFGVVYLK